LLSKLLHWRDNAKLLHHTQRVLVGPAFCHFAARDAKDRDPGMKPRGFKKSVVFAKAGI